MIRKEQLKIGLKVIPVKDCPASRTGEYMEIIDNKNGEWQLKDYYGGVGGYFSDKDLKFWEIYK